ncbi:LuxR C-terminal-related transcriptional regulator [Nocardia sp. NPDC002869]|uniref:response regulator transcription factor n=1 Tax=Nocardia sp. NPDC002869 TaxID=3161032 RepID=UPI00398CD40C
MQRVLVVDEHPLMLAGLRAVLAGAPWVATCLVADNAEIAWRVARRHHPQLVLVSVTMEHRSAFELCRLLGERMPHTKIVLMSAEGLISAASATAHGAVAALSKRMPTPAIVAALERVAEGARVFPKEVMAQGVRLSQRELDVVRQLASGLSNPEVAAVLNLSRHTVKQHTSAVYRKLGVRNRAEAASRAQELGLLDRGSGAERPARPGSIALAR